MNENVPSFLHKALDLLVDTVCVVDGEGRFVYVSASCESLLGYAPQELIGRNMLELVHPDDRERTLAVAESIMRDVPQTHFENRWVRKDGRAVDIMWSARWSAADGVRLAVARDVTPLKHAAHLQSALYRISEAAHLADDLTSLCGNIHRIIGELLPVDRFQVVLYDASKGTVAVAYGEDAMGDEPRPLAADTPLAEVLQTGTTLVSVGDDRRPADASAQAAGGNWLGAPLVTEKAVVGALVLQTEAADKRYDAAHGELLNFVSTQVATVLERKRAEERLRHLALHDSLTGLPNRALFHDRFEMAVRRADRDDELVGLLYVDLDDFKSVNDTHGHEAGDRLLCAVAERLVGSVRAPDTVARMGGDEFTVLLAGVSGPEAFGAVVDRVRAALAVPYPGAGATLTVSASIGAALYPQDGSRETLLRRADARMYAAKLDPG